MCNVCYEYHVRHVRNVCRVCHGFNWCNGCDAISQAAFSPLLSPHVAGSCGRPLPATQLKVVDVDSGAELGPDDEGELCVAGPQVMIGVLNRYMTLHPLHDVALSRLLDPFHYR